MSEMLHNVFHFKTVFQSQSIVWCQGQIFRICDQLVLQNIKASILIMKLVFIIVSEKTTVKYSKCTVSAMFLHMNLYYMWCFLVRVSPYLYLTFPPCLQCKLVKPWDLLLFN